MTRLSIALAVATGIAPDVWAKQGWRAMITAADLLEASMGDRGRVVESG